VVLSKGYTKAYGFRGDGLITYSTTHERASFYGCVVRGSVISNVIPYEAGIICAIRNGVGAGVFSFRATNSANGFESISILAGDDIRSYITRENNAIIIDTGMMGVLLW
jgi:hypothetical protein